MAFQGIVDAGDGVVEEVVKFCKKAELITWPLKVLRALLDDDGYRKELLGLLSEYDTEYARNVEPKIRVVTALGEVVDEDVRQALVPFLDDANETVRFHAVETTYLAENEECLADMVDLIEREESVRIKNKVAEGVEKRGWKVPEALLERTREALRDAHEFTVADDGSISRRRR